MLLCFCAMTNQCSVSIKLMNVHEFDNSTDVKISISNNNPNPNPSIYIWCKETQQRGKCKVYGPYYYGSNNPVYKYKWSCCNSQAKNPQGHVDIDYVTEVIWCEKAQHHGKCKIYGPYDCGYKYKWSCCNSQAKNPNHHTTKIHVMPKQKPVKARSKEISLKILLD